MKILACVLFVEYLLFVTSEEFDRKLLCESCIAVAKELDNTLLDAPVKSRQAVTKKLLQGAVCDKLPEDKRSSCKHLLDIHRDDFKEALSIKALKRLDIVLCYEQSTTCVGVKLKTFKDRTTTSKELDMDALLEENKEKLRFTKPIQSSSTVQPKEEL